MFVVLILYAGDLLRRSSSQGCGNIDDKVCSRPICAGDGEDQPDLDSTETFRLFTLLNLQKHELVAASTVLYLGGLKVFLRWFVATWTCQEMFVVFSGSWQNSGGYGWWFYCHTFNYLWFLLITNCNFSNKFNFNHILNTYFRSVAWFCCLFIIIFPYFSSTTSAYICYSCSDGAKNVIGRI